MGHDLTKLVPRTRWLGKPLEVLDVVDSTNRRAEELAAGGAPDGTAVLADRQTAGRGRLGRSFFSPPGVSIYLSLLLREGIVAELVHSHVFAAAVAVARVCRATLRDADDADTLVEIKWPNDVLLRGRKTSGINLCAQLAGAGLDSIVLGVGVNVNPTSVDFPEVLRDIATSLRIEAGHPLDRAAVTDALLLELEAQIDTLRAGGFDRVLAEWRKFFRMDGARVRVGTLPDPQQPQPPRPRTDPAPTRSVLGGSALGGPGRRPVPIFEEAEGRVIGVDAHGALLLDTEAGERRILAGDVTVLDRGRDRGRDGGPDRGSDRGARVPPNASEE